MSGEVKNNPMVQYSALMTKLDKEVKSGKTTQKEAQQALLEFRRENQLGEFQPKTVADAENEAKESAGAAMGFQRTTNHANVDAAGEAGAADGTQTPEAATAGEGAVQQAAEGEKELTPMQELLLKQAQEKYPDNTIELDKDGKIVVKDKKTGEIDKAKTEEAKQIEVNTGTADITIEEGKARPDVKLTVPTEESVEKMKQYDTKKEAHAEFTTGTKAAAEEAKAKLEQKKEEIKRLEKEAKELDKSGNFKAAIQKNREIAKLNKELQGLQNDYDNAKAISSKKGDRGIARAARRNAKNYDRLGGENEKARQVFISKDQEEAYLKEHPEDKGHTVVLSRKQQSNLGRVIGYAQAYIEDAEEAVANATDPAAKAEAEKQLQLTKEKFGDLATCMDDNDNIDAKKLKEGLLVFSGADGRFNIDEKTEVAKFSGLKNKHIRSLAKELGFGDESATARRFGAAGIAAATTALASLIGPHKKSASAKSTASATETVTVTDEDIQTATAQFKGDVLVSIEGVGADGNPFVQNFKQYVESAPVTETAHAQSTATATASVVAEAVANASAKIPILGQLAGPVVAGIAAFIMANPQSKDAFNGVAVEEVLENLNAVSGKDNKKIVANIQNMEITGDPARDKAIKAAVIQASLGGNSAKANTEELLGAYQMLKDTKDALDKIKNLPPVEQPTPTPPNPTPPNPTPPTPVPEHCQDIQERSTHGDIIPSGQVKGHGQSPGWIANAYVNEDGSELTKKQRSELIRELSKPENKQVREDGNFDNGRSKIGYRYRKEITLSDGTVVKLVPTEEIAERIGKGQIKKVVVTDGKEGKQYRVVTTDCATGKVISEGPWKDSIEEAQDAVDNQK